ncbi:MAG: glutamine synthetase III [Adlercreutzia equolifaciens]
MSKVTDLYGSMVFNEHVMRERLPKTTYKQLMKTIKEGAPLNEDVANVVAHAMKEWAIEGRYPLHPLVQPWRASPPRSTMASSIPPMTAALS